MILQFRLIIDQPAPKILLKIGVKTRIYFIPFAWNAVKSLMSKSKPHDNSFDWMGGGSLVEDNLMFFKPISVDILS